MTPSPLNAQDVEQAAAALLSYATTVAHGLAELAVRNERYDELAALAAAAHADQASCHLPLPEGPPTDADRGIDHHELIRRMEAAADALDELGRCSADPREVRDRHTAAFHARAAVVALRNALPVEEGAVG
ncbi:hypothetical protein [Kitasatospora brasiliensis]|uniref:hypothetical protein n=1 Tax=Kitasatospora brasiliensis TaxID=3058040 RepID=UPI00292D6098|nr:hypothetical protein [Kitasatospora sp. K002]